MSVGSSPVAPRSAGWMVSPTWDLAFIVASPIAIVPALWLLTRSALTPEQLALPVFAFATLGHHLPGYMRAYGDRQLFDRFRTRFVAVPPLLFGVVLALVAPGLFGLELAPPSSLQLLLVLWGAWHGLMQIYGFMRIYDAKEGGVHGRTQRLDLALCFAIFVAGFLYSDGRTFALFDLVLRAGLPVPDAAGLAWTRWLAGAGIAATTLAWLGNAVAERRAGRRMGGVKALLAASTAGIYLYSGLVTTDILLGGAVFEVFHAVQYFAIVWTFNRRLETKAGADFGPLRFLFRDRWASVVLYLGAIALFGSSFLLVGTPQYGPIRSSAAGGETLYAVFSAFFVTSSLLHYYYDGFIWKLHDRSTGGTLGLRRGLSDVSVPALRHFAKWTALAAGVAAVIAVEVTTPVTLATRVDRLRQLEDLTPAVPELRRQLIALALAEERLDDALAMAERNARVRPRSHESWADLGRVAAAREDWPRAERAWREARDLKPDESVYLVDLARVVARQGAERSGEAAALYAEALRVHPDSADLQRELALVELQRGAPEAAVRLLEPALARDPASLETRGQLLAALLAEGRPQRAVAVAREGVELAPDAAAAHRYLGVALGAAKRHGPAARSFAHAHELDPTLPGIDLETGQAWLAAERELRAEPYLSRAASGDEPSPTAHFLLGEIHHLRGRAAYAELSWQRFVDLAPTPAAGQRRLGARLAEQGYAARAIRAYREALALDPDHAPSHHALGKLLFDAGERKTAREAFAEARRLGQPVDPLLWARAR